MFSGWSAITSPSAPSSGGGGGTWSTGSGGTTSTSGGGGWSLISPSTAPSGGGGTWSTGSETTSTGGSGSTWSTAPALAPVSISTYSYAAPTYYSSSYQGSVSPYALPGAGLYASIPGEGGAYTPIDFPLMHELLPGERLEDLNVNPGLRLSRTGWLLAGLAALFLLKGK